MVFEIIVPVFLIVFGIPNRIIDSKHRKKKAYQPGHEWSYYAQLSKEGNWEGRFVMWSSYLGIGVILALCAETFYVLRNGFRMTQRPNHFQIVQWRPLRLVEPVKVSIQHSTLPSFSQQ